MPRGPVRPGERISADLRRRLASGEWADGEALPTTAQLAAHYRVSNATITRVIRALAAEGLVYSVPRWGVFAGRPPP